MPFVRKHRKTRRLPPAAYAVLGAAVVLGLLSWVAAVVHEIRIRRAMMAPSPDAALVLASPPATRYDSQPAPRAEAPERVVYNFSVIPGGVRNRQELERAESRDPVVRRHFADFIISQLRIVQLPAAEDAYVSYRVVNDVFWTRKKIRLEKGEPLLTDGVHYARVHCGNRVSEVPQPKTSPVEPTGAELETPVARPPRPSAGIGKLYIPPRPCPGPGCSKWPRLALGVAGIPVIFFATGTVPPNNHHVPTPEPGTLWLVSSGAGALAFYLRRLRSPRRNRSPGARSRGPSING